MSDPEPKAPKDENHPSPDERRHFLKVVGIGGLGAGLAAVVGAPAVVFVTYPLGHETISGGDEFIAVGKLADFAEGKPTKVEIFANKRDAWNRIVDVKIGSAWILRDGDRVRAFSTVCPHLGCAIDHEGEFFKCPCHRSAFGLDGAVKEGPSPRSMDELEVQTEGEAIAIRYRRFKQGVSAKEAV
jgi:menaquinol-cytochrome c reductase iron-sulfur subunit